MRLSYRPFALWVSATTTTSTAPFASAFTFIASQRTLFVSRATSKSSLAFISGCSTITTPYNKNSRTPTTSLRMASTTTTSSDANKLRVALCQFPVTSNKETNHQTAADYVDRAAAQGAQLVILPEIWNSPYATSAFPEYAEVLPRVGDTSIAAVDQSPSSALLMECAKQHGIWIVGGSIPERDNNDTDGKIYNTCIVYDPSGKVVAKHRKVHLFDIDVPGGITFVESDTLSPGNSLTTFSLAPTVPDCTVGVGICYDIRFALQAMLMCQSDSNCKLLIYPGAFNMTTGPAHWELLQRARAIDNQCFVVTASPARTEAPASEGKYPHYTAWGHSTVVSPWGDVVTKADEKEALVVCDLDLSRVNEVRNSIPILKQKRTDLYKLEKVQ